MILGKLVRLRPVERDDLKRFVEWFADPELRSYLALHKPIGYGQEEKWYERNLEAGDEQAWAIEACPPDAAGPWTHIGSCGLHRIQWRVRSAELGISIGDRRYWGRGYGTDTVRTLVTYGFGTLNLNRIFLRVFAHNARAIRAYEKVGFQHEGRLREDHYFDGRYVDTLILSILQSEWRAAQLEKPS